MRTPFLFSLLLPAVVLTVGCDSYYSAEIDAPEICFGGIEFPFVPPVPSEVSGHIEPGTETTTEHTVSGDELGIPDLDKLELELNATSLAMMPMSGVADLEFIHSLSIRAVPAEPESDLAPVVLAEQDAGDRGDDGALRVLPGSPADLAPLLRAGDVTFQVALTGELPEVEWQAQMELCVHARASYREQM